MFSVQYALIISFDNPFLFCYDNEGGIRGMLCYKLFEIMFQRKGLYQ